MRRTPLLTAVLGAALIVPATPATSVEEIASSTISTIAITTGAGDVTGIAEAGLDGLTPAEEAAPAETFTPGSLDGAPAPEESPAETAAPTEPVEPTTVPAEPLPTEAPVTEAPVSEAPATEEPAVVGGATGTTGRVFAVDGDSADAASTDEASTTDDPTSTDESAEAPLPVMAVRTEPIATDEFTVAGLTWDGDFDPAATNPIYIRLYENDQWSEWFEVGAEDGGPDDAVGGGTDPIITGGATAFQLEIHGDASGLPANLQLAIVPEYGSTEAPAVTEATDAVGVAPDADAVAAPETDVPATPAEPTGESLDPELGGAPAGSTSVFPTISADAPLPPGTAPTVITRARWGADAALLDWDPVYARLRAAIVHHTAGSNNYTKTQSASIVRGIYSYHAVTRGWGDIGYNFLVDKYGQVFEGRYGTLSSPGNQMVIGGHARPYNTGTLGISVMGNYVSVQPSLASIEQLSGTIAWRFTVAGVNPNNWSGMTSQGIGTYAAGRNLPTVMAHREVAATTCPGDAFYNGFMQSIRVRVTAGTVSTMNYYLENQFDPIADLELVFGRASDTPVAGDWNGDGRDSIGARSGITFSLSNLISNRPTVDLTFSYGNPGDRLHIGDWDGDGRDSIMIQRGATFYIRNSLTTGVAERQFIYGDVGDEILVGDWNGDGVDTLAVRRGNLFLIRNSLTSGVAEHGFLYGDPGDEVFVGDWNGDGVDSIAIRRFNVFYVRNTLTSGVATNVFPFGNPGDSVLVGDWNGDGKDTFGVTRPSW